MRLNYKGYLEKHHIIPKCKSFGGSKNGKNNLVKLTPKEHYICHLLLMKMCKNPQQRKSMAFALFRFGQINKLKDRKMTAKSFEKYRTLYGKQCSGKNNPFYGKKHSKKVLKIIRDKNIEWCRMNGNSFLGHKHKQESKDKVSKTKSLITIVQFLNGKKIEFQNIGKLGIYLGKSTHLGYKLLLKDMKHLWKKYNIKNIWRKNENKIN